MRRTITIIILVVLVVAGGIFYYNYYFVFGDGTKAGTMNYFVHKGYLFKTYEGRLIQSGFRSQTQGSIQSNEFRFSVTDKRVADQLSRSAGAMLEVHYKEYLHALPWRGVSEFVVDSIISSRPLAPVQP